MSAVRAQLAWIAEEPSARGTYIVNGARSERVLGALLDAGLIEVRSRLADDEWCVATDLGREALRGGAAARNALEQAEAWVLGCVA